ncbi:hypothetical protein NIES298_46030, partial [Microcystis aeruginosa NIES-298]
IDCWYLQLRTSLPTKGYILITFARDLINPHYPYGKWYFYERILQVPVYIIFQPQSGELEVYRLVSGKYELQKADEDHRYWRAEIGLFLGVWQGKKAAVTAHWLRWWDQSGNLLLWGSERIEQTEQRAEQAERRAEGEKARADRLAAQLKARGIDLEAE